jgi:hypothetical protein
MWNEPDQARLNKIPRLYATDGEALKDKLIHLHFFMADCDWYVAEFDGGETFFGFAILNGDHQNSEWGYFSFGELKAIALGGWLEVDCELEGHWRVRPASQIPGIKV